MLLSERIDEGISEPDETVVDYAAITSRRDQRRLLDEPHHVVRSPIVRADEVIETSDFRGLAQQAVLLKQRRRRGSSPTSATDRVHHHWLGREHSKTLSTEKVVQDPWSLAEGRRARLRPTRAPVRVTCSATRQADRGQWPLVSRRSNRRPTVKSTAGLGVEVMVTMGTDLGVLMPRA